MATDAEAIIMDAYDRLLQRRKDAQESGKEPDDVIDLDEFGWLSGKIENLKNIYNCLIKMKYIEPVNIKSNPYCFKITERGER
jgi:hypothetical protein